MFKLFSLWITIHQKSKLLNVIKIKNTIFLLLPGTHSWTLCHGARRHFFLKLLFPAQPVLKMKHRVKDHHTAAGSARHHVALTIIDPLVMMEIYWRCRKITAQTATGERGAGRFMGNRHICTICISLSWTLFLLWREKKGLELEGFWFLVANMDI